MLQLITSNLILKLSEKGPSSNLESKRSRSHNPDFDLVEYSVVKKPKKLIGENWQKSEKRSKNQNIKVLQIQKL